MSEQQFQSLYSQYLPQLYRAALCLTGDSEDAARATEAAFLGAAANRGSAADTRDFAVEAAKRLFALCRKEHHGMVSLPPELALLEPAFSKPFCRMNVMERAAAVFGGLMHFGDEELAEITGSPFAGMRLRWLTRYLRASDSSPAQTEKERAFALL